MTKITNEMMANLYHNEYSLHFIGLSFFSIYGKFGRPDTSYFKFLHDIKINGRIILNGNEKIQRLFTNIDDAVVAITKIIKKCSKFRKFNQIYNTGNNKSVKINEILKIIKNMYPKKFSIIIKKGFQ